MKVKCFGAKGAWCAEIDDSVNFDWCLSGPTKKTKKKAKKAFKKLIAEVNAEINKENK